MAETTGLKPHRSSNAMQARRTRIALVLGAVVVLATAVFLLSQHRANLRLLAEKQAEADRKEAEVQALATAMQADLDAAPEDPTQSVSELSDVLEENERNSRQIPEILRRIGAVDPEKVEVRDTQLGAGALVLAGCAIDSNAVNELAESFSHLKYLTRQPDPASSPGANACSDVARPRPFALKWVIQDTSKSANPPGPTSRPP